MRARNVVVGLTFVGAVLVGATVLRAARNRTSGHDSDEDVHNASSPAATPAVTVVHKHVMVHEGAGTPAAQNLVADQAPGSGPKDEIAAHAEVLLALEQNFQSVPEDPAAQSRNEATLRAVLSRTNGDKAPPIDVIVCRGSKCRAVFNFESADQAKATLNVIHEDEEWIRAGLGFNAIPEHPDDQSSNRFVVYFTAEPTGM